MFSDFRKWLDNLSPNASFYAEAFCYLTIIIFGIVFIWRI